MPASYEMNYPGRIIFGNGSIQKLSTVLPPEVKKIMLTAGKHALKNGLIEQLEEILGDYDLTVVTGITPEPPLEEVDALLEKGRSDKTDTVVAVGGGSVIDAAKAAACLIPKKGKAADYFYGKKEIKQKGLFFVAVPTTAGTGAEITKNSVLTDSNAKIKKSIRHHTMVPDVAIIDPELTLSSPPALTAASGLDAFTQAVESYISGKSTPVSRSLAITAVKKIFKNLPRTYSNPNDIDARKEMAEGSMITAMAFAQSGLGAVHGIAHPLGSLLNVPHGQACATLLQPVLEWNMPKCRERYSDLATACETNSPEGFIQAVAELRRKTDTASDFKKFGLSNAHFDFIIKNCRSNSMKSNPRPMSDKDVIRILEEVS
jgi:alcohol dehydrogenase class IV